MKPVIRYGYVDTTYGQIHYREAGSGPPLVLFHESPLSGRLFEAALPLLGRKVRAIAPDTPGYGASHPPTHPLDIDGYASLMSNFLDTLGITRVSLVGHHTGGSIAMQMAVNEPKRVESLVVVGCTLWDDKAVQQRLLEKAHIVPEISPDGSHMASRLWGRWLRLSGKMTSPELIHMIVSEEMRVFTRPNWAIQAAFRFDARKVLPAISCPTLFLITEGDELRFTNEAAVDLTPKGEGKIVDMPCGQYHANDPEGFASDVLSYLDRVGYLSM